ncbi:MAG: stage III sporulation protein AC [Ruminococcus sp.]|jgi:stage III sporulation protein AC|nr:stage III sporulation protein AC [Ruminococcus sp.]
MDLSLIFKVAGIGLIMAFINVVLEKSDRKDFCMMVNIAGAVVVFLMLADEIAEFFNTLQTVFGFN